MITTNLNKPTNPARHWFDLPVPAAAGIIIFALYLIVGLVWQLRIAPSAVAVPTPGLIILIATQAAVVPAPAPTAAAVVAVAPANGLKRAVVAYSQPDASTAIGAIEAGRVYQIVARYGASWLQADVDGSGTVWLRADQVLDLPAGLADLQPTPAPIVVNQPVIVYQPVELAAPTPAPEEYAVTNAPPPACSTERQCAIQNRLANEHQP